MTIWPPPACCSFPAYVAGDLALRGWSFTLPSEGFHQRGHGLGVLHAGGFADVAFAAFMKIYPTMKEKKLNYLYFRPITFLKGKWNDQQKKELIDLSLKLSPKMKNIVLQNGLKYFADEIKKF